MYIAGNSPEKTNRSLAKRIRFEKEEQRSRTGGANGFGINMQSKRLKKFYRFFECAKTLTKFANLSSFGRIMSLLCRQNA